MGLFDTLEKHIEKQSAQEPEPSLSKSASVENETPPPDLSRIHPDHRAEYTDLWYKAHKLADFVDGGEQAGPYEDRIAKMPELNAMVEKMRAIEFKVWQEQAGTKT